MSEVSQFLSRFDGGVLFGVESFGVLGLGSLEAWSVWGRLPGYPAPELQSACHIFPTIASRPFKGYLVYPL